MHKSGHSLGYDSGKDENRQRVTGLTQSNTLDHFGHAEGGYTAEKVQCVDMFCWTGAVETVMSLVQQNPDDIVKVGIDADELAVTKAESKATYGEIQARVKEQTGLNVTPLYIAQVKRKHGIIERECYNKAKSESAKMLICPTDKEKAIEDALRFFGMIA